MTFEKELQDLINRHSIDNEYDTPDYILAEFIRRCLDAYSLATVAKDTHKGVVPPGATKKARKAVGPALPAGPRSIYIPRTVRGDGPFAGTFVPPGVHEAHVNEQGAVSVKAVNGNMLGIKPSEYTEA